MKLPSPTAFHDIVKVLLDWRGEADKGEVHQKTNQAVIDAWQVWYDLKAALAEIDELKAELAEKSADYDECAEYLYELANKLRCPVDEIAIVLELRQDVVESLERRAEAADMKHHPIYCAGSLCGKVDAEHNPLGEAVASCRIYNEGHKTGDAEGYARAIREVVAWLPTITNSQSPHSVVLVIRDAIERGEHKPKEST